MSQNRDAATLAHAGGNLGKEEKMERCEDLMSSEPDPGAVQRILAAEWGCSRSAVRRYMTKVRELWQTEQNLLAGNRDEKRVLVRQKIMLGQSMALNKKTSVVTREGDVVEYSDPDLKSFLGFVKLECQFEALLDDSDGNNVQAIILAAARKLPQNEEQAKLLTEKLSEVDDE